MKNCCCVADKSSTRKLSTHFLTVEHIMYTYTPDIVMIEQYSITG